MKIYRFLNKETIFLDHSVTDKDSILRFVANAYMKQGLVKDAEKLYGGMKARELTMSTGIGKGIGIPHTTSTEAKDASVQLIRLQNPIDFEALDNVPVDIILAIVIPEGRKTLHLQILARVARLCQFSEFISLIKRSKNQETLYNDIVRMEDTIAIHS